MLRITGRGSSLVKVLSKVPAVNNKVSASFVSALFRPTINVNTNNGFQAPTILGLRSFCAETDEGYRRPQRRGPPRIPVTSPVLLVRGLPWERHNEEDIRALFGGLDIAPNGITICKANQTGKPTGLVFVQFSSIEETQKALRQTRNIQVDERNVFVRPSSDQERDSAIEDHKKPSLVVVVRKLPYSASESEVRAVFPDAKIDDIAVGNGLAYIRFASQEDVQKALEKSGVEVARRKTIIIPSNEFDLRSAQARPPTVVRIRGAPTTATEQDFKNFFKDLQVQSITMTTREGISGRTVPGDVFIEFADAESVDKALKLDRQNMGERYLQIFKSSKKERRARLMTQNQPGSGGFSPQREFGDVESQ